MKRLHKTKAAFTMLELVFVIVVLGILAALALPRMDRDIRQEARNNLLSAFRYTQHLALMDNKVDPSRTDWQRTFWQIRFTEKAADNTWSYTIGTNRDHGTSIDKVEAAVDPANGKYMYNNDPSNQASDESSNIFISDRYGINDVSFSNCSIARASGTTAKHIAFDHLGRPHRGISTAGNDYATYVNSDCNITFTFSSSDITPLVLTISKETGYVTAN